MMNQPPTPIAIIGMGCRFPGGANSPEKLWEMLSEGRSGWSKVPADRWNNDAFHQGHSESQDGFEMKGGHFIDQDVAVFDPAFFGISSHEAESMDPQQRILLETTYEALENAGIPQESIRGSDTGVYAAYFTRDYDKLVFKDTSDIPKQHITGGGDAIISNRISYVFDLKGPSMTIDTGCSGSMVGLHLACQSLQSGETSMSLVGGVNLHLVPDYFVAMSFANILNKDGRCYTFDSRGAGYGRGEGSATIVLKRLDKALEDGDHIRGVIRNSYINQDGKTNGISLPNKQAQKDLVRSIYASSGLDPRDTGYVEAHGTGTVVGDNAEIESISELFCDNGKREDDIYVGSVKTNIGHLEATSGLAGLIKTILILEKGYIPPNLNLEVPKKGLRLEERKIKVPQKLIPWSKEGVRRASINSYGYGGTNCHAILEAAPASQGKAHANGIKSNGAKPNGAETNGTSSNGTHTNGAHTNGTTTNGAHANGAEANGTELNAPEDKGVPINGNGISRSAPNGSSESHEKPQTARLFAITAKSKKLLPTICENLRQVLISHEGDEAYLRDLAYTLSCRRSLLQWRTSIVASTHQELVTALDQDAIRITKSSSNKPVAFLFTGQGAQWHAMGRELISRYPVFEASLNASSKILKELGAEWDLIEELTCDKSSSRVNQSEISQPVTTTIQIALVDLLTSFNIKPQAVLGHSSGEIGAAYAAGALSHESALTVSYRRGFVANACRSVISGGGSMLAAGIGEEEINPYIERLRNGLVCVACVNSPSSTTISGDVAAIDELSALLNEKSIFNRKLKVDVAYHSHHMRKVSAQYLESIQGVVTQELNPEVKFFSSVTGFQKTSGFGALYWVENLVSQVKFSKGLKELSLSQQVDPTFIEVGPHSALQGPVRQIMSQPDLASLGYSYSPTLLRDKDATATILDMNRSLFESGFPVDLGAVNSEVDPKQSPKVVNDLTPYAWDHSVKYWKESRLSRDHRLRQHPSHDLLGLRIVSSTVMEPIWRHIISIDSLPWLRDHVVDNSVVFPGAGYLCMAIEGIRQISQDRRVSGKILNYVIRDVSFYKALIVPEAPGKVEMLLTLRPSTKSVSDRNTGVWEDFRISSLGPDGNWSEHCNGSIYVELVQTGNDEVEGHREEQLSASGYQEELESVTNGTPKEIDTDAMYRELAENGNNYGPSFAAVKGLRLGDRQGLATIKVPDIPAFMPSGFFQPHVIHPTTLDALMQIGVPLFSQHCGAGAIMPVFAGEIAISADILSDPGTTLTVTTKVSPGGPNAMTFNSTAFQVKDGQHTAVIRLSNGDVRRVGESVSALNQSTIPQSNYNVKWNPDVNFLTQADILRAPDNIEGSELRVEQLDRASSLYINECLRKIGDNDSAVLQKHHLELLHWMRRFSTSEKCRALIEGHSSTIDEDALNQLGVEGEIITRLGSKLEQILLGDADPLSLMLEGDLLYRIYADSFANEQCYLHMANYLKLLSFKKPYMRVLEIGAGTGSATTHLLNALKHEEGMWLEKLDFTDISSGFFDKVKPKLEEYNNYIEYNTLDVERDPLKQGFEAGSYDLIVASNVLHATSRMDNTLANVRTLLKPGGRLALVELTELRAFVNITFGTLSGWWAGVEDGRTDSPLLSVDGWEKALSKNGFGGVELAVGDYENSGHTGSFIVSKAIEAKADLKPVEVICSSSCSAPLQEFANNLVPSFQERGFSVSIKPWPTQIQRGVIYVVVDNGGKPHLVNPSREQLQQVTSLTTAAESLIWISAHDDSSADINPERALIAGLSRVARTENSESEIVVVDIQQSVSKSQEGILSSMSKLLSETFAPSSEEGKSTEVEFVYKDDQLHISRALPDVDLQRYLEDGKPKTEMGLFHQTDRALKLHVEKSGLLDSIVFVNDELAELPIGPDEIEIETRAHGINFKDVFIALGQMKPTERMTGESAGFVTKVGSNFTSKFKVGDRVCGMMSYSPFATRPRVLGNCAHILPDSMPFTVGASIPIIYLTAWLSLVNIAKLRKGQTVLIHAASGGVGQAAIMIAQHFGAEIFATVGSTSKSQLLVERYGIPQSHIFSSRMRTFKQGVLRLTKGKGVDVVLNSLSGEVLHDTWACIAPCGTFVEIGKADILKRNSLNMSPFDKMVTFASFDLGVLRDVRSEDIAMGFSEVMALFEEGSLEAVEPVTPYDISEIEDAFRLIQARKHRGKLVLTSEEDSMVKVKSVRRPLSLPGDGTIVVGGGLGDLGRRFCRFVAEHGAKHIVTLSRRGLHGEERQAFEQEIAALGAEIHIFACDVNDRESVQGIAALCRDTLPPVRGLVQAAMVLRDGNLETMEYDAFMTAVKPKFDGTRNLLDAFSSPSLDRVIMLSSLAGIIGNPGQGNYVAGCTYQDELANSHVQSDGAHFISLNLALVEGSEVDTPERRIKLLAQGIVPVSMKELLGIFEYALSDQAREDDCRQIINRLDKDSMSNRLSGLMKLPMLNHLQKVSGGKDAKAGGSGATDIEGAISSAATLDSVQEIVSKAVVTKISSLVALSAEDISLEVTLADLGLDSLVAIELKNWIVRSLQAPIQTVELLDMPNIRHLVTTIIERSALVSKNLQVTSTEAPAQEAKTTESQAVSKPSHGFKCCSSVKEIRKLPLLDLKQLLQSYLSGIRALVTEEEYANSVRATEEFMQPGGNGQKLYNRLVEMHNDLAVENWMEALYLQEMYLRRRAPVALYYDIMCSFGDFPISHTQAERAAVVAATSFKFKQDLEDGKIAPDYLNEVPLCMEGQNWLFNTTRNPLPVEDEVVKYSGPGYDYLIVLRSGHFFKVSLKDGDESASVEKLRSTFQSILDLELSESWVGILTTDDRDPWATNRKNLIELIPENEATIRAIDGASFLICLDDDISPTDGVARIREFMLGRGINRWHDKSIQFLVAKNASTAFIGDHTKLDGASVQPLLRQVKESISTHHPDPSPPSTSGLEFEELVFQTSPSIEGEVTRMRQTWLDQVNGTDYEVLDYRGFGATYLKDLRCNAQSGFEIVAQLASLMMFGQAYASWQPVNMSHYHKGRPEVIQTMTPTMLEFCTLALQNTTTSTTSTLSLRKLFFEASREHAGAVLRAHNGFGYHRTLTAMECLAKQGGAEDGEIPALYSDAAWLKAYPHYIMTGPRDGLLSEVASVWPSEASLFVNYDVYGDGARFCIVGHNGRAKEYGRLVEKAGEIVKSILGGE